MAFTRFEKTYFILYFLIENYIRKLNLSIVNYFWVNTSTSIMSDSIRIRYPFYQDDGNFTIVEANPLSVKTITRLDDITSYHETNDIDTNANIIKEAIKKINDNNGDIPNTEVDFINAYFDNNDEIIKSINSHTNLRLYLTKLILYSFVKDDSSNSNRNTRCFINCNNRTTNGNPNTILRSSDRMTYMLFVPSDFFQVLVNYNIISIREYNGIRNNIEHLPQPFVHTKTSETKPKVTPMPEDSKKIIDMLSKAKSASTPTMPGTQSEAEDLTGSDVSVSERKEESDITINTVTTQMREQFMGSVEHISLPIANMYPQFMPVPQVSHIHQMQQFSPFMPAMSEMSYTTSVESKVKRCDIESMVTLMLDELYNSGVISNTKIIDILMLEVMKTPTIINCLSNLIKQLCNVSDIECDLSDNSVGKLLEYCGKLNTTLTLNPAISMLYIKFYFINESDNNCESIVYDIIYRSLLHHFDEYSQSTRWNLLK